MASSGSWDLRVEEQGCGVGAGGVLEERLTEGRAGEERRRKGAGRDHLQPETGIWEGGWWNERWWWALKMCVSAVGRPRQHSELPGGEALSGRVEKGPKSRVER